MAVFTTTPDNKRLARGHHWYIVCNSFGVEVGYVAALNHNQAEEFARTKYGHFASVAYTEV